uniref:DUF645 family protein n=1 Tax=Vibrio cholerae TaxID=666 RepID=UPI0006ACD0F7
MLDVPHSKFGFTKGCIITVIWFSLSRTLKRGQLNLDRFAGVIHFEENAWNPTMY